MRKIILILIFSFLTNVLISQEVHSKYEFKKEKNKSKKGNVFKWNYVDSDNLILYKNGTFHRIKFYSYHEIIYSELKGEWKIEGSILILEINKEKKSKLDEDWTEINSTLSYRIKKRKIKPINGIEFYATRNLKLEKNNFKQKPY